MHPEVRKICTPVCIESDESISLVAGRREGAHCSLLRLLFLPLVAGRREGAHCSLLRLLFLPLRFWARQLSHHMLFFPLLERLFPTARTRVHCFFFCGSVVCGLRSNYSATFLQ